MFGVDSEVGRLRQVILHRPGLELKRLTPDNAADLLSRPNIDGGLIGGASLKAGDFAAIVAAA